MGVSEEDPGKSLEFQNAPDFINDFKDCFGEMGTLKKTHHITVDPSIQPVIHAARRTPFSLQTKLKAELSRMCKMGVIEPVHEPTDWVSSLVMVEKPNGKVRVCLDPRDLNKAIKRHHFKLPSAEELFAEMSGAKYFTKLDASNGYWQIKVDNESSKLLTFSTPYGRYKFNRMPFGIKSASEVFQQSVAEIIEGISGVRNSQDDIIIWGESVEILDRRTKDVLSAIQDAGMKLNKDKCVFRAEQLTFLGHVLSGKGISPDPSKIEAIREMPAPSNKTDLKRFLGMVAYLGKFIPNLANSTAMIRKLLEKDVIWDFNESLVKCYNRIKTLISSNTQLRFFDPQLSTKITCDASQSGLGATLEQLHGEQWFPVAFASRSMTSAEKNYCQMEKETLSIVFACKKFHDYVYGRKITIENDHKPLMSIFLKDLNKAPPRIQRFILYLQRYDFDVMYVPGGQMTVADSLSRASLDTANSELSDVELESYVHVVMDSLPISDVKVIQVRVETGKDEALSKVAEYVKNGWPEERKEVNDLAKPFFNVRHELTLNNGVIMKGTRIVIPYSLRKEMKDRLHIGHIGVEKTKLRAREVIYWPGIDQEISDMNSNCSTCIEYRNRQQKEPLIYHEIPSEVWTKLGTDLFEFNNDDYLIVVDYTSKYFEISKLQNTKSETVIAHIKSILSRHGIPKTLISDNGPQYISDAFKKFAKEWEFSHVTSSPEYPQSNGMVEWTIQSVKRTLKKAKHDGSDPYLAMLHVRTTPLVNGGISPTAHLMRRNLQTMLPPVVMQERKHVEKPARELPELQSGDSVRFREKNSWSRKGVVINRTEEPRSYKVLSDKNTILRRNRRHLLRTNEKVIPESDIIAPADSDDQIADHHEYSKPTQPRLDEPQTNGSRDEVTPESSASMQSSNEKVTQVASPVKTRSGRTVRKPARYDC